MSTTRFLLIAAIVVALIVATFAVADDACKVGGEFRRQHNCLSVRHTKTDVCCWLKADGTHGKLPRTCCGTGWEREKCADLVDEICETHHEDM